MSKLSHVGNKLANRGTKLFDATSAAVAQGAQLSSVVASKAADRAEDLAERIASPEKLKKHKRKKSTPGKGIRDRINKFDSASKSHVDQQYVRGNSGLRGVPRSPRSRHHDSGGSVGAGEEYDAMDAMPNPIPPPCNPHFYEKENEPNNLRHAFESDEGMEKPAFRRKKNKGRHHVEDMAVPPNNPSYRQNNSSHHPPVNPHYRNVEQEGTRNEKPSRRSHGEHNGTGRSVMHKSNNADRRLDMNDHRNKGGDSMADLEALNRAAILSNSKPTTDTSQATRSHKQQTKHNKQPRRYNNLTKKRDPIHHPLIQSPLRKHIRGVHDSAVSNATCTMLKDPFPLLPPRNDIRPLAAVAGWETEEDKDDWRRSKRGNGRDGFGSSGSGGGMGHLDALGTMTGKIDGSAIKRHAAANDDDANNETKKDGEGAALDLLTSAAFLFKHSRRNLG
eukprot:CAMPEP_0183718292 /NCGR_PEP_ID=MMETSP0737-20130205/11594_1 /TAXON_ID=385413 /ORGANISM="Thalassiosira miniscula, Strain CCMP1093" /LENGTH=446 /DNA_ID=CAMNT_0025947827 /DNA_START=95 /DNA_END=1435 /DNA_ORIENTATION=-